MAGQPTSGRTILVAIDGSQNSDNAFTWVLGNIFREGDNVVCVHSAEYKISSGFSDAVAISNMMKEEQERVGNLIAKYAQALKQNGVKGKSIKMEGMKAGEAIVQAAKDESAQIIVTGTRGLGTIRRTIIGSVSDYVVHHATCPVIIYRE
ncbi:universal stress protein in QAH/OAS sulfhydrylase 3'region-like [Liolophura sinensis]|uniref:universal stress protein in QAH/OAS sulfhydrylase 3'region-like n=1 Tax=Liolophura sinensis TaxID=3198878 RepID=UPI0031596033